MPAAADSQPRIQPHPALNIALWVCQVLLALAFGLAGIMKTTKPIAELAEKMIWPGAIPPTLVRFIGGVELTAAVGLLLPSLTRVKPSLTPLAAIGLVFVQTLAIIFHISRGEARFVPINLTLGALALFVAWGRFKRAPLAARG